MQLNEGEAVSLFSTISRAANTAMKLPFSMAWDVISLGNMGDGASTAKVLREHQERKSEDDMLEALERAARACDAIAAMKEKP